MRTDLAAAVNNEASLLSQLNAANTQLSSLTARLSALETTGGVEAVPILCLLSWPNT